MKDICTEIAKAESCMIFRAESACEKQRSGLHLPRIIGMLVTGIILGPFVLDVLDPKILGISSELRQKAASKTVLKNQSVEQQVRGLSHQYISPDATAHFC